MFKTLNFLHFNQIIPTFIFFSWHKMCFNCKNCKKMLESGSEREHDNEVYCKTCHGRNFGPKGYGYGGGAGALSMEGARK